MDTHVSSQIKQLTSGALLKMEGNLVGEWAEEAKSLMTNGPVPKGLIVDLTDVSYIDSVGEQVLAWLGPEYIRERARSANEGSGAAG